MSDLADDLELEFIAGQIWRELPKEKRWLLKYFKSDSYRAFLKYFLTFNSYYLFWQRTGYYIDGSSMNLLQNKILTLLAFHAKAKSGMDFETLSKIEMGKYKIKSV